MAPIDTKKEYAEIWAARAMHDAIATVFELRLFWDNVLGKPEWTPHAGLSLTGTSFVEPYPWPKPIDHLPPRNLKDLLQELSVNATLSLFATPALAYLENQDTTVETSSTRLVFAYDATVLLATYGAALAAGLVSIIIGVAALASNGVSMDAGFVSILATTRNPALDGIARGACLGATGPSQDELRKVKLRLGEVSAHHVAMGTMEETQPLRKGKLYI
jgi:hypothetical protein